LNIVCIDPSLNNTALIVNGKRHVFVNDKLLHTKTGQLTKWFKLAEPYVTYHPVEYDFVDDYSASESQKLKKYDDVTGQIRDVIADNCNADKIHIYIEGYSYSSAAGPLIDLVTYSTLLRQKCIAAESMTIVSPTQLKVMAAKLTYPAIQKGKRTEYRNKEGMAGGSFKKKEIYKALTENELLQDPWTQFLREHELEILGSKTIAKPMEDLNDATILFHTYSQG
jgi:hypothetical protein